METEKKYSVRHHIHSEHIFVLCLRTCDGAQTHVPAILALLSTGRLAPQKNIWHVLRIKYNLQSDISQFALVCDTMSTTNAQLSRSEQRNDGRRTPQRNAIY